MERNERPSERALETGDVDTLTTNQGCPVAHNQDQLTAGPRGGTLMEDFIFREKMTHFDHERMPERVVHARGSAAHGVFRVYDDSMKEFTKARFLTDPSLETETFTRFSTVVGFRGSADTVRDARGFSTKFYTVEGVYDLVGNNMPVFFIQDGMKVPDLVHSVKPEPRACTTRSGIRSWSKCVIFSRRWKSSSNVGPRAPAFSESSVCGIGTP